MNNPMSKSVNRLKVTKEMIQNGILNDGFALLVHNAPYKWATLVDKNADIIKITHNHLETNKWTQYAKEVVSPVKVKGVEDSDLYKKTK